MKHYVREWLISTLMWVGLMLSIPLTGLAQERPLELNLAKGFDVMPELRSMGQKVVTSIVYYSVDGELNGTALFEYTSSGKVSKMQIEGNMGHMRRDVTLSYEVNGNELRVYEIEGSKKELARLCLLNDLGYIVRETGVAGSYGDDDIYTYTYDNNGQTKSATFNYNNGVYITYTWINGNVVSSEEPNTYTNIPNKANLNLNAIWREYYSEDRFGFALCGYIGNNDANLVNTGEEGKYYKYELDEEGYPIKIFYYSDPGYDEYYTLIINYGNATITDPDPTPDPTPGEDTLEDEFIDAIEQAPEGSEENPTEIFIPTGGVTLHQPLDINKHIRLTGGSLMRGEDNPYAMLRVREGYSLDLDGVTIDGGNTDLQDGSIIVYGKLRMREGSQLKNCYRTEAGTPSGAICVAQSGYVRMDEGVTISGNTGSYGSAIYCEGFFEMYGGEISGNNGQIGAVVVNSGGTFRMHDGKISGNKVTEGCGGIYVGEGCRFEIYSGEVSDNAHSDIYAWSNVYAGSPAKVDGLVYFAEGNRLQVMDTLQHDWTITFLGEPQPGTVVAVGYTTYHLTEADLNHIHYADDTYKLALDGNTIVITKDATGIEEIAKPRLIVMEKTIRMENYPENVPYVVYNMYGRACLSGEIDGVGQATFSLSNPGIYIVKCQNETYKVKVK